MGGRNGLVVGPGDAAGALARVRDRAVNYDRAEVREPQWHVDAHRADVAHEPPGPPVPGGPWEVACRVVRDYEFTPPALLRALYDPATPLLGRDILLEGRFAVLRFHMPVRITSLVDESDGERRAWGWGYETLEGHLERGEVVYRVVKHLATGRVEFTADSHSQPDPQLGSVLKAGWAVFGRRSQLRFYSEIAGRLRDLVAAGGPPAQVRRPDGLVVVPSGSRPTAVDRIAVNSYDPAARRVRPATASEDS